LSAGRAVDVRDIQTEPLTVLRTHTCDDGTGSFTALLTAVRAEHGGTGPWKIVEGTGRYVALRGMGTYEGQIISGSPDDFETIVYRTMWRGIVDFDAAPPTVDVITRATKLRRPPRTYSLRIALSMSGELPGANIAYTVEVKAGRSSLATKQGATTSGGATVKLRIRPLRRARSIQIVVTSSDPVGNESTVTRSLRLR
jgi:hypothetical protein